MTDYRSTFRNASGFRENMARFRPYLRGLGSFIWPDQCPLCDAPTEGEAGVCASCWSEINWCNGACCYACGVPVMPGPVDEAPEDIICASCAETPPSWDHTRALMRYDGQGKRAVLSLKTRIRADLVANLGQWLALRATDILRDEPLVLPVPMHPKRLRQRGFNQAAILARAMVERAGHGQLRLDLLQQMRVTPKLAHINMAAERYAAKQGSIAVRDAQAHVVKGRRVLLVDDVLTSGATLHACTLALREAGAARIEAIVVARHGRTFERRPLLLAES